MNIEWTTYENKAAYPAVDLISHILITSKLPLLSAPSARMPVSCEARFHAYAQLMIVQ